MRKHDCGQDMLTFIVAAGKCAKDWVVIHVGLLYHGLFGWWASRVKKVAHGPFNFTPAKFVTSICTLCTNPTVLNGAGD